MLKYSPPSHADHELLEKALLRVKETLTIVNASIDAQVAKNAHKILSIYSSVTGNDGKV